MQETGPQFPRKEEALARCEVGVDCAQTGECFLATISHGVAMTANETAVRALDEIDDSLPEKAAILQSIVSKLAACGIEKAAADYHSDLA